MITIKDTDTHATLGQVNKEPGAVQHWCDKHGYTYHHSKGHGMRVYVVQIKTEKEQEQ